MSHPIAREDQEFIARAANYLENPSFLVRLTDRLGEPLEKFARVVPARVHETVEKALRKAMEMAVRTLPADERHGRDSTRQAEASARLSGLGHTAAMAAAGAFGGLFGLTGLAVELPISTGILFRSIAKVAGEFGEDLSDPRTRLECLTVFSYGAPSGEDEAFESAYLTTRLGLAVLVQQAAALLNIASGEEVVTLLARGSASVLLRLLAKVAGRFDLVVAEKALAQALPVVGAIGGGVINAVFAEHYNTVARFHFGLRRLERRYGADAVEQAYRAELNELRAGVPELAGR
jgi:hypothetical protein